MKFRVEVTDDARDAIRDSVRYIAVERKSPLNAERWLARIWHAVDSLERFPHRCPLAPESRALPYEVRAKKVGSHMQLFHVDDDAKVVNIVGFRHGRRRPRPGDLPPTSPD
jgi:plasmid stabilization system protein ParE